MNLAISLQYVCILYEQMSILQYGYEQMSVKDRLNEIKSLKLMSIKLFAETTNLSYRTAQNYLSGDREPNLEGLIKICTHLGVNLNWLVAGIGEPFIDEIPQSEIPHLPDNENEQALLALFRQADEKHQQIILSVAQMAQQQP